MTSPIDAPVSYRLPIGQEPLNRFFFVSEIFSIKFADTETDTSTDNKGLSQLAAGEPII